ncbi:hypothetical protein HYFRA_00011036 [Hymenoscyphus fraxineus]|uniref:Major facilitator superfamily (MFS) profile domain-containing protein n=1 Tax=Hymenoscyphus fraxineus TaxID=746836 RepID=A0A9N9L3C1_9HELO|nr:hypothetical protein HYFRA_00011036 [Hymenoscyphus fraxineus]
MIESFGVERKDVAKWAGITSAVFSIAQCLTAILWGRASDMFGRKPAILCGLTFTMCCTLFWGISSSLPMAIVARALSGACNGNVGIIRTMVAEMVPEKELQPRAFSIMPLVWSLGSIFGPSFGGFFAKPAENMPGLFGHNALLIKFPFLLPNLVASFFFLTGISTGIFFLKETLETKKHRTDWGLTIGKKGVALVKRVFNMNSSKGKPHHSFSSPPDERTSLLGPKTSTNDNSSESSDVNFATKSTKKPDLPRPTLSEVFTKQSVINLAAYTLLALHAVAYDQLLPIFMHNPQQKHDSSNTHLPFKFSGGFGLGSGRIGTLFTLYGICGCFIQFLIFPPTARYFGVLRCFKACALTFPVICFLTPFTALIQNSAHQQATMFAIMILKSFAVIFAFPCSIILLTNSAASLRVLGTLNGVAVSVSAVGRAVGPALGGAAFTWGLERGYVITPWWLLGSIAALGAVPIWYLEEMEGFNKTDDDSSSSSESDLDSDSDSEQDLHTIPEEPRSQHPHTQTDLNNDEASSAQNEDAIEFSDPNTLSRVQSRRSLRRASASASHHADEEFESRVSCPIGIGEPVGRGGRRLSNSLAGSASGYGIGGTSFA